MYDDEFYYNAAEHDDIVSDLDVDYKREHDTGDYVRFPGPSHGADPSVPYPCACGWAAKHSHTGPFIVASRNADGSPRHRG